MSPGALLRAAMAAAFIMVSAVMPVQAAPDLCVAAELRDRTVSFRTEDDVELSGLELGSGSRGVVLASSLRGTYCEWLPIAQTLADEGFHVLVFDVREFDRSSEIRPRDGYGYDRDVVAAAKELRGRGASSIVVGGELESARSAALAAPKVEGLTGLVLFSPMQGVQGSEGDGVAAMGSVTVPAFIVATDGPGNDDGPSFADLAEKFAEASDVPGTELQIVSGEAAGGALVKEAGPLRDQLVAFVGRVSPETSFVERWWPAVVGGVVVLLGLLAFVLLRRRRLSAARR